MAGETGLEPAASAVTGRRYNQLNYSPAKRIERNRRDFKIPQLLCHVTVRLFYHELSSAEYRRMMFYRVQVSKTRKKQNTEKRYPAEIPAVLGKNSLRKLSNPYFLSFSVELVSETSWLL